MNNSNKQQPVTDPRLHIPAEANREKHINFMDAEEQRTRVRDKEEDDFVEERKKQWQEGLEEGRKAAQDSE